MLNDGDLTDIVQRARCHRCDGKGFHVVPAESDLGERLPDEVEILDCKECAGHGIKLGLCRLFASELTAK